MRFTKSTRVVFFLMLFICLSMVSVSSGCPDCSDDNPCITVRADKVVCDSESDLPNWGGVAGVPYIDSTTASDYVVASNGVCSLEDWEFQFGRNEDNPGNNVGDADGWIDFDSGVSLTISDANQGTLWFREVMEFGYVPFSGDGGSDVTAEFYCDGDSFKYDNYDYISDEISNGDSFYCVGFNALECQEGNGPVTSDLDVSKYPEICQIKIEAIENDSCSIIEEAEYFLGGADCGVEGTGVPLAAEDGDFDSLIEEVIGTYIWVNDGSLNVHVRGKDILGNWGECQTVQINLDCLPPFYPTCEEGDNDLGIALDGVCNADELLVCGDDPLLTATVCDEESAIQLAEYFIDEDSPWNWHGINMSAVDGTYLDELCEDVEDIIDISGLLDGTHYVQVHGKDSQENWGKFEFSPIVSFIKDTTPPKVEKNITFNGSHVQCYGNELVESGVFSFESNMSLIDPCYYVKQGTAITLTAYDFNPDNDSNGGYNNLSGEYSNNVVIRYIVRWKNESGDGWTVLVNRTGEVNKSVIINLSEDSYHLIEYWAVDLCGEESEHRWELDIVDTQAPEITKQIIGPQYYNETENKTYIDGVTRINLTCVDPEPHPVNDVSIYYRYRVDEGQGYGDWTDFFSYGGVFGFPEQSKHELEYYCIDALGNEEEHKFEVDYVDKSPPNTTKTYGEPFYTDGLRKWINSSTPITLTSDDGDEIHDSGVAVTYWRNHWISDPKLGYNICGMPEDFCHPRYYHEYINPDEPWNIYTEPFFKPEESCHIIEYYSVDNVNKTEEKKWQCVFVDNSAPNTTKIVGEPKYYNDTDGTDWWVTQETNITLNCSDVEPHPVGYEKLCYKISYDEPEWLTEQYCGNFSGDMEGDWCCLNDTNNPYTFHFTEDCFHDLEWYCEDKLGNRENRIEYDEVDTQAPNITKFVILENGTRVYSPENGTVTIAINSDVTLNFCADVVDYKQTGDAGVGVDEGSILMSLTWLEDPVSGLVWNETVGAYCNMQTLGECGKWHYEVEAEDLLGNWVKTNGIEVIVDNVAPVGEVLNPHSGNYYRDGVPFQIYAPAVDFGGDDCSIFGCPQDCPASGVDYCELYAIDYAFEDMNQSEIKECYRDLWTYFTQINETVNIVPLGNVSYVDGVCKGYVSLPENSGLTDTVFLGINYVDKAGNEGVDVFGYKLQLALNPWFSPVTMNIDNEGPMVSIVGSNLPGPLTSSGDGDNVFIEAEVVDYDSGFDGCWAEIYYDDKGDLGEYVGVADIIGTEVDYNLCRINGAVPDGLESGNYWVVVNVRDELFNIGSSTTLMIVDNTRPTMSVVSPEEEGTYGVLLPVSLNVNDSQSPIADETVRFKISEIPAFGNAYCILGTCETTGWITLSPVGGLYAKTINITEYDITGSGRYVFDAVACDNLYVPESDTDLGFSLGNSRTDAHCRMISEHGQVFEENRSECDDGIDNDLDGDVDLGDGGCYGSEDDDEGSVCGNGYVEGGEDCDDGNIINGDGCSSNCVAEAQQGNSSGGGGCCSSNSVKINEFVANPVSGNDWVELYNPGNSSVDLTGWKLNDSGSEMVALNEIIGVGGFVVFEVSNRLNMNGDFITLISPSLTVLDSVSYGNYNDGNVSDNALVALVGNSTGRSPDGQDTDVDNVDFQIFTIPTPGSSN
ncbi:lamin tail domain-containing protein [Candidatus Pacearchaeota archaeon]|nr:lamin tail domain-containing protein [Candidatus Pacearchaeota archaeon]